MRKIEIDKFISGNNNSLKVERVKALQPEITDFECATAHASFFPHMETGLDYNKIIKVKRLDINMDVPEYIEKKFGVLYRKYLKTKNHFLTLVSHS